MQIAGHRSARERTSGHRGSGFIFLQLVSIRFDESFSGSAFMSVICNFYENGFRAHGEEEGGGGSSFVPLYFPIAIPGVVVIRNLIPNSRPAFVRWMEGQSKTIVKIYN